MMAKWRKNIRDCLKSHLFLTQGGLETDFIFNKGYDLPYFSSFHLLESTKGTEALINYYVKFATLALENGYGYVFETATWRASKDWARLLGMTEQKHEEYLKKSVQIAQLVRIELEGKTPMILSGNIGPRGDGYNADVKMTVEEAFDYHSHQIGIFADVNTDIVTAVTITYPEEAIGITKAAQRFDVPVVIGFTLETNGKLPCGISLQEAIEMVDETTNNGVLHFLVNCAHLTHYENDLLSDAKWVQRIGSVLSNASRKSHEELDACEELDDGDPVEFGQEHAKLVKEMPQLRIIGGCCGTDLRHIKSFINANKN